MKKAAGILAVSLLALASSRMTAAEKPEVAAWVVQCRGDFEVRLDPERVEKIDCKKPRNELWYSLTREAKLAWSSKGKKESVTIRIARTGEVRRFNCDTAGDCEPPRLIGELAPNPEAPGPLQAFLTGPANAYTQIRLMLSRSNNSLETPVTVDHAVLSEGEPFTLKDLIRPKTRPGEYLLELCPFNAETGCPTAHKPIRLKWDPAAPAAWPEAPKPGLFEVVLSEVNNGTSMRTKDRGLVLLSTTANDKSAREQVIAGEALFLKNWKDKDEGKLMFQALLLYLASPAQAGK